MPHPTACEESASSPHAWYRVDVGLPREILLATDFSDAARTAAETALALAERLRARLHWLHVTEKYSSILPPSAQPLLMQYVDEMRRSAKRALASECARAAERGIDGTVAVGERPVPQAIAQRAEEVEADWVLLGARGHGASVRALLGSVAERTVRACARTTLVVRGPASPLSPGLIVLGDDFSEAARVAREAAVALAREFGARLHVVHALDLGVPFVGPEEIAVPSKLLAQVDEEARTRLAAFADSAGVEVETSVVSKAPAAAICQAAVEAEASLIVTGSHGYTGLSRLLLGSTAEKTLRHASCSVLTVKPSSGGGVGA